MRLNRRVRHLISVNDKKIFLAVIIFIITRESNERKGLNPTSGAQIPVPPLVNSVFDLRAVVKIARSLR